MDRDQSQDVNEISKELNKQQSQDQQQLLAQLDQCQEKAGSEIRDLQQLIEAGNVAQNDLEDKSGAINKDIDEIQDQIQQISEELENSQNEQELQTDSLGHEDIGSDTNLAQDVDETAERNNRDLLDQIECLDNEVDRLYENSDHGRQIPEDMQAGHQDILRDLEQTSERIKQEIAGDDELRAPREQELSDQVSQALDDIEKIRSDLEVGQQRELADELQGKHKDIAQIDKELAQCGNDDKEKRQNLSEQRQDIQKDCKHIENELSVYQETSDQLGERQKELDRVDNELAEQPGNDRGRGRELSERRQDLQLECERIRDEKNRRRELVNEARSLQKEIGRIDEEKGPGKDQSPKQHQDLNEHGRELRSRAENIQKELDQRRELSDRLMGHHQELSQLENEVAQQQENTPEQRGKLGERRQELRGKVERLQNELDVRGRLTDRLLSQQRELDKIDKEFASQRPLSAERRQEMNQRRQEILERLDNLQSELDHRNELTNRLRTIEKRLTSLAQDSPGLSNKDLARQSERLQRGQELKRDAERIGNELDRRREFTDRRISQQNEQDRLGERVVKLQEEGDRNQVRELNERRQSLREDCNRIQNDLDKSRELTNSLHIHQDAKDKLDRKLRGINIQLEKQNSSIERYQRRKSVFQKYSSHLRWMRKAGNLNENQIGRVERILDGLKNDRRNSQLWHSESPQEQSRIAQKAFLNEIKGMLETKTDMTSEKELLKSIREKTQAHLKNYTGIEVESVSELAERKDAGNAINELRSLMNEYEKQGLLQINKLEKPNNEGLFIKDVSSINSVWELAIKARGEGNYNEVRGEFYKLLHPATSVPVENKEVIDQARKYIEDAGFTFHDIDPGRAPRLVSPHDLSFTSYTLSLQHDIPQKYIRNAEGHMDHLYTDPGNLRFTLLRDNIHEDSRRFGLRQAYDGRRPFVEHINNHLDDAKSMIRSMPGMSDRLREKVGKMTDELLNSDALQKDLLSGHPNKEANLESIREQYVDGVRNLSKLERERANIDEISLNDLQGIEKQKMQENSQREKVKELKANYDMVCDELGIRINSAIASVQHRIVNDPGFNIRAVKDYLDDIRDGRTKEQQVFMERMLEMWNQAQNKK